MLHFTKFVVRVGAYELVDDHVATTHSDHQLAVKHLGIDLARSEHIVPISEALNRNWAASFLNIITKQFIKEVSIFGRICNFFRCGWFFRIFTQQELYLFFLISKIIFGILDIIKPLLKQLFKLTNLVY